MPRRHAIVTCCDARCGDFLIQHWLTSLRDHADLRDVDVVVLDYGLSDAQRLALSQREVRCFPCVKDGYVCNLRYRDICRLLDEVPYEQILSVDSGDVIFQADIRPVFDQHPDLFRAAAEQLRVPFFELLIDRADVHPEVCGEILKSLADKPMLNAGVVWGPAAGYRAFWDAYRAACRDFQCYGVDQMILNYVLYRDGFAQLDERYNFVLVASKSGYRIRDGVFYDHLGRVIPIVHNAGNKESRRAVHNFGYGAGHNQRKRLLPIGVRLLVYAAAAWRRARRLLWPAPTIRPQPGC